MNVEISKEVVRVERWQGRMIAVLMMIRQQMVCVICIYGPLSGRRRMLSENVGRSGQLSDDAVRCG